MHNIILKIFEGKNTSKELQNGDYKSQKLSKIFFSKNCYKLYLLIIFINKIEVQKWGFVSSHFPNAHLENLKWVLSQMNDFVLHKIAATTKRHLRKIR